MLVRILILRLLLGSDLRCSAVGDESSCSADSGVCQDRVNPRFELLVHDTGAPCVGPPNKWSCVRDISPAEIENRDAAQWGLQQGEVDSDKCYMGQILVNGTMETAVRRAKHTDLRLAEAGLLKMNMTDRLRNTITDWFVERRSTAKPREKHLCTGYGNSHSVGSHIVSLHRPDSESRRVNRIVIEEMHAVMEWWTKRKLKHTASFGVRMYGREGVLFNHLDHTKTHIASAILQVSQQMDDGNGWPLEVIDPSKDGSREVYLQPGEMLLYEGARLVHGRPKRLKGDEFANAFVHFAPV